MKIKKSIWKFPYNNKSYFVGKNKIYMINRNITLTTNFLDQTLKCHKGNVYGKLKICEHHLGHKLGEFFSTKITGARIAYRKKIKKLLKNKKRSVLKKK